MWDKHYVLLMAEIDFEERFSSERTISKFFSALNSEYFMAINSLVIKLNCNDVYSHFCEDVCRFRYDRNQRSCNHESLIL